MFETLVRSSGSYNSLKWHPELLLTSMCLALRASTWAARHANLQQIHQESNAKSTFAFASHLPTYHGLFHGSIWVDHCFSNAIARHCRCNIQPSLQAQHGTAKPPPKALCSRGCESCAKSGSPDTAQSIHKPHFQIVGFDSDGMPPSQKIPPFPMSSKAPAGPSKWAHIIIQHPNLEPLIQGLWNALKCTVIMFCWTGWVETLHQWEYWTSNWLVSSQCFTHFCEWVEQIKAKPTSRSKWVLSR